jgi:adenylylsulfate kinase
MKNTKTIWFMGLPCSGKTTLADALAGAMPWQPVRLDGDVVREGLCAGLGHTPDGRNENIRRCAELAQMLNLQGFDVVSSFITPYGYHRRLIATSVSNVYLIHVNTPAAVCEQRDSKGLWKKARDGQVKGFTGLDDDFEPIELPHLKVDGQRPVSECVDAIITYISRIRAEG